MLGSVAAGAGRQCAPAAPIGRFWAAPQLIRYAACCLDSDWCIRGLSW